MSNRVVFQGGAAGQWRVSSMTTLIGGVLPLVERVEIVMPGSKASPAEAVWVVTGLLSNLRYATASELVDLRAAQEGLGRPAARRAALIPIRKSPAWWALAQDERRAIFEETSHHTRIGLGYLPEIARQLHHCRDIGEQFDFLTWFEFAPGDVGKFDDLVGRLRETEEWRYVDREIDIRLERAS